MIVAAARDGGKEDPKGLLRFSTVTYLQKKRYEKKLIFVGSQVEHLPSGSRIM